MYCRHCGGEVEEGSAFCTRCGAMLDGDSVTSHRSAMVRRRSGPAIIAVMLIAAALLIGASSFVLLQEEDLPSYTVGETTVYGDLVGCTSVEDGKLVYTSDGTPSWSVMDAYGTYLEKVSSVLYEKRTYSALGTVYMPLDVPGEYRVHLTSDTGESCTGTVLVDGTITKHYTWACVIDGVQHKFRMDYTYSFADFKAYADKDAVRYGLTNMSHARMVVVDDSMVRLAEALKGAYAQEMGYTPGTSDQNYADCILSFVQCEIAYPDMVSGSGSHYVYDEDNGNGDLFMHGTSEYWAYPMETIHHGMGDCEDTSFLASAIFSASGYGSAIALLPGHMVVAVELDRFSERTVPPTVTLSNKRVTDTGKVLYFCETTTNSALPAGYLTLDVAEDVSELGKVTPVPPHKGMG